MVQFHEEVEEGVHHESDGERESETERDSSDSTDSGEEDPLGPRPSRAYVPPTKEDGSRPMADSPHSQAGAHVPVLSLAPRMHVTREESPPGTRSTLHPMAPTGPTTRMLVRAREAARAPVMLGVGPPQPSGSMRPPPPRVAAQRWPPVAPPASAGRPPRPPPPQGPARATASPTSGTRRPYRPSAPTVASTAVWLHTPVRAPPRPPPPSGLVEQASRDAEAHITQASTSRAETSDEREAIESSIATAAQDQARREGTKPGELQDETRAALEASIVVEQTVAREQRAEIAELRLALAASRALHKTQEVTTTTPPSHECPSCGGRGYLKDPDNECCHCNGSGFEQPTDAGEAPNSGGRGYPCSDSSGSCSGESVYDVEEAVLRIAANAGAGPSGTREEMRAAEHLSMRESAARQGDVARPPQ
jgi:hypothetical protein